MFQVSSHLLCPRVKAGQQVPRDGSYKIYHKVSLKIMNRDLPRVGDEDFSFLDVCGAEVHDNVDHEKEVYDQISVQKWVSLRVPLS